MPAGDQPQAIDQLVGYLEQGEHDSTLLGVTGSGKTYAMANVLARLNRPGMVLAHNKTLAAQLYAEFKSFFPTNAVEYFVSYYDYYQPEAYVPARDLFIDKDSSINDHIEQLRLSATKSLIERRDVVVVASVSAIFGIGNPVDYHSMILHLREGEQFPRTKIIKRLIDMQYRREKIDFKRGTFRVKGDVIEVFPSENSDLAIKIEMFDDEIEKLTLFDPLTSTKKEQVKRFTVYPSTHYALPADSMKKATKLIKDELNIREAFFQQEKRIVEAQRIKQRTLYDLEMMTELGFCSGIENYSRHLSGRDEGEPPPTLFDYLPNDGLLFIDESHVTLPQVGGMYRGDRSRKQTLVEYGFRLPSALDNRPLKIEEFDKIRPQTIYVSATPADTELKRSKNVVEMVVRPTGLVDPDVSIRPATNQVDDLLVEIAPRVERNERVLVTTLTKRMAEQLTEFLSDHGIKVRYLHSDIDTVERAELLHQLRQGVFDVLVGINLLREGLDLPEVSLVAILDADKEGFLRSARSLIQTIGRAARHINGTVFLYADKETDSIKAAIAETERRRAKQEQFNQEHNIVPQSIAKKVAELIEVENKEEPATNPRNKKLTKELTDAQFASECKRLEGLMLAAAKDLEFEKAAELRDELRILKEVVLGIKFTDMPKQPEKARSKKKKRKRN